MEILLLIGICLLILALYWEFKDYQRLYKKPPIKDIKGAKEKLEELKFYACFNSENNITWRSFFINSFCIVIVLAFLLNVFTDMTSKKKKEFLIIAFSTVFFVQYFSNNFKTFHLYRLMSAKVRQRTIL
jgi:hypothetical protein